MISTSGNGRCSTRSGSSSSAYLFFLALKYDSSEGVAEPEHDDGVRHLGAHHGHIARMVARRFFLLVGGVLLFIHDDQGKISDRGEHRRARTDHHAGFSALDAMPLLGAFFVGERRNAGWPLRPRTL